MDSFLQQIFAKALFVGIRVSMLMVFAPFFGSGAIANRLKAGLTVVLTALLYPAYAATPLQVARFNWLETLLGEVAVGLMLGLTVQFVFEGVILAGQILGFQLGFTLENVIDPQTQVDTPVLAVFQQSIAILIFFQLRVHHRILLGLAKSLEYLPPGVIVARPAVINELIRAAGGALLIGVQIAAPVLVATMLTDVALGFIGRASPQLPVLLIGISVKDLLGLAILGGGIVLWSGQLAGHFDRALRTTERLLHLAR